MFFEFFEIVVDDFWVEFWLVGGCGGTGGAGGAGEVVEIGEFCNACDVCNVVGFVENVGEHVGRASNFELFGGGIVFIFFGE